MLFLIDTSSLLQAGIRFCGTLKLKLLESGGNMLISIQEENLCKFKSKMLRHAPEQFGIILDHEGYCGLQELLMAIRSCKC